MTSSSLTDPRSRPFDTYVSKYAGSGRHEAGALVDRRGIRIRLQPPAARPVVDPGGRPRELVRLQVGGFEAQEIDISPERAALARAGDVVWVRQGNFGAIPASHPAHRTAITGSDLPEHLTKPKVLQTFDDATALASGDVFVNGIPRAMSSIGGHPSARADGGLRLRPHLADGNVWYRVALTAQTGMLRGQNLILNLTFAARKGWQS